MAGGLAALAFALVHPAAAGAFRIGFFDGAFTGPPAQRDPRLDEARVAGASMVRLNAGWPAARSPRSPTDPSDPAYAFRTLDDAVRAATDRGLRIERSGPLGGEALVSRAANAGTGAAHH